MKRANVIGSGPNGLAAAIVLAQAGYKIQVFEAEAQPGGAARTFPLTLPGFLHDFGSAVHPMAVGSPFFSSLPLADYGLQWIHPPSPLAHPLDDGTAVVLEQSLEQTEHGLGADGRSWRKLLQPLSENWPQLAPELLGPISIFSRHPFLMAKFGLHGFQPATWLAKHHFKEERTRGLFAGIAAHSFLSLDEPLSSAFGLILAATAHAVGWPIPKGGAQAITDALCRYLQTLGGEVHTASRIDKLADLPEADLTMCDVTPRQLLSIAGDRFTTTYKRDLAKWKYGPAVFKVDYALSGPIPWRASGCARAATVHLGGSLAEIAASEKSVRHGQPAERPFILLAQPSLFDPSRAPAGQHTAWAYCHLPNGSSVDMLPRIEAQIERFAPGFRERVLARKVFSPPTLEDMDANLVGGDISGGLPTPSQLLFRPTWRQYSTTDSKIYVCSSSTPPGGGVHGMCGYHAAKRALARSRGR